MIRQTTSSDFKSIFLIINDAAVAYKGVIPDDRWHNPYMTEAQLHEQIDDGVIFYCYETGGTMLGVMGIQDRDEVTLIRHAYVWTQQRQKGIGGKLLDHLMHQSTKPILIGTWKAAVWAIRFYEKHGFSLVSEEEKNRLLHRYWNIPERQIETSVVLADRRMHTVIDTNNAPVGTV